MSWIFWDNVSRVIPEPAVKLWQRQVTEESFLHAVWPFSCSRRIRLRRSGKMFSNTTSWNRLPSTVETVPKSQEKRARVSPSAFGSTYPPFPTASHFSSPRSASPRFVMLIVSNSEHHRYVYFPFSSPSFLPSARHTLAGRHKASFSSWAIEPRRIRPLLSNILLSDITSDGRLIIFYSPRKYHPLYFIGM